MNKSGLAALGLIPILISITLIIAKETSNLRNGMLLASSILIIYTFRYINYYSFNFANLTLIFLIVGGAFNYLLNSYFLNTYVHWYMLYAFFISYIYVIHIEKYGEKFFYYLVIFQIIYSFYIILKHILSIALNIEINDQNLVTTISVPLMYLIIYLQLKYKKVDYYIVFIISIIGFLVSIASYGRSGIISSSMLVLAALLAQKNFSKITIVQNNPYQNSIKVTFTLILLSIIVYVLNKKFMLLNYLFAKGLNDSERFNVVYDFISSINIFHIFWGDFDGYLRGTEAVERLSGDFHNTHFEILANFGIFGYIFYAIILFAFIGCLVRLQFAAALIISAIVFRLATDSVINLFTIIPLMLIFKDFFENINVNNLKSP